MVCMIKCLFILFTWPESALCTHLFHSPPLFTSSIYAVISKESILAFYFPLISIYFDLFIHFNWKPKKYVVLRYSLCTHLIGFHKYGCICFFFFFFFGISVDEVKKRTGICLYLYVIILKFNKTTVHPHIVIWWRTANTDTDADTDFNLPTKPNKNIYINVPVVTKPWYASS